MAMVTSEKFDFTKPAALSAKLACSPARGHELRCLHAVFGCSAGTACSTTGFWGAAFSCPAAFCVGFNAFFPFDGFAIRSPSVDRLWGE